MPQGNLLEIHYDRVSSVDTIILTPQNCEEYGYSYKIGSTEDGRTVYIYYPKDGNQITDVLPYDDETLQTTIQVDEYTTYTHIAPDCSNFKISYADVDKEGSGRNELTGEMFRERIGNYFKLDLTWDLIPNSIEYNNWYLILTHLPPKFKAKLLMPSGFIEEYEMYRGDISTELYLWTDGKQIWKGLSTSFIQNDVNKYDDTYEPILFPPRGKAI